MLSDNMEIKKPDSMEECLYFTSRILKNDGFATAWVYRPLCDKCKKGKLGKPIKKNGKPDKKSPNYECPNCKHQITNEETESRLKVEIEYKCVDCGNEGMTTTEHKRITFEGVQAYVFTCEKCNAKMGITKKMKKTKKE